MQIDVDALALTGNIVTWFLLLAIVRQGAGARVEPEGRTGSIAMRFLTVILLLPSLAFGGMVVSHSGLTEEQLRGLTVNVEQVSTILLGGYDPNSPAIDAFDRQRVSEPFTIFDSKQLIGKDVSVYWDEVTNGTGSITYNPNDADSTLAVLTTNDYAIRQTRQRMNYQPGKSQMVLCTFTRHGTPRARLGYFNSSTTAPYTNSLDGIWLEMEDGTNYLCVGKSGVVNKVAQGSWNLDKLDGTGASGYSIDTSRANIFFLDFEWLGVGRVRAGFVLDGLIVYAHEFLHANNVTDVYMTSPNHSVRYGIWSFGATGMLHHICSAVVSEGGLNPNGVTFAHFVTNQFAIATASRDVTILAMRLKTNMLTTTVIPGGVSMVTPNMAVGEAFAWELVWNPSYGTNLTWSDVNNASVQIARGPYVQTTGGVVLAAGFVGNDTDIMAQVPDTSLRLGSRINGTVDEIHLRVTSIGANGDPISSLINWRELQ